MEWYKKKAEKARDGIDRVFIVDSGEESLYLCSNYKADSLEGFKHTSSIIRFTF